MKKRILSILLVCCMVLTLLPATAFAAEVETGARASNPGGLCEHHPEHDDFCCKLDTLFHAVGLSSNIK